MIDGLGLQAAGRASGWRRYAPREPKAFTASLLIHASIIAALLVSIEVKLPRKPETRTTTFNVSLQPGDGREVSIPKAAVEKPETKTEEQVKPVEAVKPDPVKAEPQEKPVEQAQTDQQASAPNLSDTSAPASTLGGGTIWTPPQPTRLIASGIGSSGAPRQEQRVELPKVDLPKGASEPVLLSYDQGRYSDATAMSEASRLMNTGTITMAVTVDEKGDVSSCVVTATSGSNMLDERACLLIHSYKYRPAQDAQGKAHGAIVTEVLEWARDGKFAAPADAGLEGVRNLQRRQSPPQPQRPAMPVVRLPQQK